MLCTSIESSLEVPFGQRSKVKFSIRERLLITLIPVNYFPRFILSVKSEVNAVFSEGKRSAQDITYKSDPLN